MKNRIKKIAWYWWLIIVMLAVQVMVFAYFGEDSYLGVHDNLDIHIVDYQIMKLNNAWFQHGIELPLLNGISRDYFSSEWSLYTWLYILFPNFTAYILGYFLKIIIAFVSCILLGKALLKDRYRENEGLVVLCSFIYALLPLYPGFSFCFASIPLVMWLIIKIMEEKRIRYFIGLFLYPMVSYFTFFGMFILGYLVIYTVIKSLRQKKLQFPLIFAIVVLSAGYMTWEYRLFRLMLFEGAETIRTSMDMGDASFGEVISNIISGFVDGQFHAYDLHHYLVLPVCVLFFFYRNALYIKQQQAKSIWKDPFNICFGVIVFNSIIYGIYIWKDFRTLFETLIPSLKGWQFTRTIFFNPLLWYICFFLVVKYLLEKKKKLFAYGLTLCAMLVVIGTQTLYNDFYNTVYNHTYKLIKNKETSGLSYREFYAEDLFTKIKEDINYSGEKAVAYGMHPAVLQYNGITTLDACLSYYTEEYKAEFRKIIEPALERSAVAREYFDNWGARAYIFSATDENIWEPVRNMDVTDYELSINGDAFKALDGVYVFSRIQITNETDLGLTLVGAYEDENTPYQIYVYKDAENVIGSVR